MDVFYGWTDFASVPCPFLASTPEFCFRIRYNPFTVGRTPIAEGCLRGG